MEEVDDDKTVYMHEIIFLNEDKLTPKNYKGEEGVCYLDNGASNHMTGNELYFSELNKNIKGKVKFGDGSCVKIEGTRSILFQNKSDEHTLVKDIYYILDLKSNIFSLEQATEVGCDVRMKQDYLTVHDPNNRLLVKVVKSPTRLYKIKLQIGKPICLYSQIEDGTWKWQARFGHINFKTTKYMSQNKMEKGDAFEKFRALKHLVEKDFGEEIITLRMDRGEEFTSKEFHKFCEASGIRRQLTAPYTPQQNGVVERRNITLMEMTRSMLKAKKVLNYLWGEAVRHATYVINRIPIRGLNNMTPYECFREKKPNVEHLKVFGCMAYSKIDSANLKNLDDRLLSLVHLEIKPGSKAYSLYNPSNRKIVVSCDMVFNEKMRWSWKETTYRPSRDPGMFHMRNATDDAENRKNVPHTSGQIPFAGRRLIMVEENGGQLPPMTKFFAETHKKRNIEFTDPRAEEIYNAACAQSRSGRRN
ncbi:uncharacterized protein LOC112087499 [Eutrema salsugineum]|uniref:uncharacterized protein LOC112087499 n=1 Tax=Eutrema salsugineum TaxID=72664 RepID=UPI000CED3C58|nr:uncharacterized protein LOC112087499 [Eutrema salsugineum]